MSLDEDLQIQSLPARVHSGDASQRGLHPYFD